MLSGCHAAYSGTCSNGGPALDLTERSRHSQAKIIAEKLLLGFTSFGAGSLKICGCVTEALLVMASGGQSCHHAQTAIHDRHTCSFTMVAFCFSNRCSCSVIRANCALYAACNTSAAAQSA